MPRKEAVAHFLLVERERGGYLGAGGQMMLKEFFLPPAPRDQDLAGF